MASKKGVGSSKNGRDSESKRLGLKAGDGQFVSAGSILVRQRGTKFHPGNNVGIGGDDTLFAKIDGAVKFERKDKTRKQVSVYPKMDPVHLRMHRVFLSLCKMHRMTGKEVGVCLLTERKFISGPVKAETVR